MNYDERWKYQGYVAGRLRRVLEGLRGLLPSEMSQLLDEFLAEHEYDITIWFACEAIDELPRTPWGPARELLQVAHFIGVDEDDSVEKLRRRLDVN